MAGPNNSDCSAPGKILLLGGYSVLEQGNVSFTVTVDAFVHAHVERHAGSTIHVAAPMFKVSESGSIDQASGRLMIELPKELNLMKTAMEITTVYLAAIGAGVSGFSIETRNDAAMSYSIGSGKVVKSGLGSSAAVSVATVSAILKAFGADPRADDAAHKLAQISHSIATGKVGSGFDIAAASYGNILYSRYSPDMVKGLPDGYVGDDIAKLVKRKWDYSIKPMNLPSEFELCFAKIRGGAAITTSLVGKVNEFKARSPREYSTIIDGINRANIVAVGALGSIEAGKDKQGLAVFKKSFDEGRSLTKKLGELSGAEIEPDEYTSLIDESVAQGAFVAKLPGAGGLDAIVALCLGREDRRRLMEFWKRRKDLEILDVNVFRAKAGPV